MEDYIFYNVNPYGDRTEDCICRAITLATGLDYFDVARKLELTAELWECDKLSLSSYSNLLDNVFKFKRVYADGMTVGEFAETHPYGTYILRGVGHCTTVIDGESWDTFDTLDMVITDGWFVDKCVF